MVGGPERELKEAMELPQDSAAASETQAVGERQVVTELPAQPPAAADENAGNLGNVMATGNRRRSPEKPETQSPRPG